MEAKFLNLQTLKTERRRAMTYEFFATTMILILCWLIMAALDAAVCGLLSLFAGLAFKKAFLWGLISLIIPPLAVAYGAFWGRNKFEVKNVEIKLDNIPESFDGYRIVHISDIHSRSFEGREEHLKKAVEKINSLDADLIAFTGDLISMAPSELNSTAPFLKELSAKDGIVSILGNHDYCQYTNVDQSTKDKYLEELIEREREMGWNLLLNENRIIRRGCDSIAIIGVENTSPSRHFPSKGDLSKASKGTEGTFRILLSHDPLHWEDEILGKNYPLTLSGHTHAMQVSLFGWSPSGLIFNQDKGLYTKGRQHLYVNIGLGETIFPARIFANPEITLITLKNN